MLIKIENENTRLSTKALFEPKRGEVGRNSWKEKMYKGDSYKITKRIRPDVPEG